MLHVQPMDSIGRLSTPSQTIAIVYTSSFIRLPVIQVDSTILPVSFFEQTPWDSRLCPLESSREYWTCVAVATT